MATQRRNEWQQGVIIGGKNRNTGALFGILIARKTGFMDVTIGNTRFYYNSYENADDIGTEFEDTVEQAETASTKKGMIWIRRK